MTDFAIKHKEVICPAIEELKLRSPTITLQDILDAITDFVVERILIEGTIDYKSDWTKRIKGCANLVGISLATETASFKKVDKRLRELVQRNPQGCRIMCGDDITRDPTQYPESIGSPSVDESSPRTRESSVSKTSTSSSSCSTTSQQKLSDGDRQIIVDMYKNLEQDKMWTLTTGKVVELTMADLATKCDFEHPACSLILDPTDKIWKHYFTDAELEEIRKEALPPITALPDDILEYINSYKGLHDVEALYDNYTRYQFHPRKQAALSWVHDCILRGIKLYFNDYLSKPRSEADLLKRVWCLIDYCYDGSHIEVSTGERASIASSNRMNDDRALAAILPMPRKQIGVKVDLLFYRDLHEYGTMEAGRVTDTYNSKTILECGMKCPKTLKDMFVELAEYAPSKIRDIRTNAFVISGLKLNHMIMDSPAGYVCRVTKLSRWLEYPTRAERFVNQLKPILEVVWNAKASMEHAEQVVGMDNSEEPLSYGTEHRRILPHCFNPTLATNTKKRKTPHTNATI